MSSGASVAVSQAVNSPGSDRATPTGANRPASATALQPATSAQVAHLTKRVTDLIATVDGLEGTVKGINGAVNGLSGTLGNLAPIIHSIAQREYATCYHASNTDSLITMSVQERLDACYSGYYTFGMFRPNDLYSDPAP